jgi:hypothetical protein
VKLAVRSSETETERSADSEKDPEAVRDGVPDAVWVTLGECPVGVSVGLRVVLGFENVSEKEFEADRVVAE